MIIWSVHETLKRNIDVIQWGERIEANVLRINNNTHPSMTEDKSISKKLYFNVIHIYREVVKIVLHAIPSTYIN